MISFNTGKLYNADCIDMLKKGKTNSVDLIVTDPPYGIFFMQKNFDKAVPSVAIWKECLRVLKPGAFAFIFSLPRQDVLSRMIVNLEDAGFDCSFTSLYWTYSSGFTKAMNISKCLDKQAGIDTTKSDWKPVTDQAKQFNGAYGGFQPKPAVEIILCVQKPMTKKTFVDQALDNGKGCTWLGDGRIPVDNEIERRYDLEPEGNKIKDKVFGVTNIGGIKRLPSTHNLQGRFPANLLVSDNVLDTGEMRKTHSTGKHNLDEYSKGGNLYENFKSNNNAQYEANSGDYSRYFSLDAWFEDNLKNLSQKIRDKLPFLIVPKPSKREKNQGCERLSEKKCNDGRQKDADNAFQRGATLRSNTHPTVKAIAICSYLIAIGSRSGDLILDPFIGSGTTALSAITQNRRWIGCELSKEYYEIAKARIEYMEKETTQNMF